MIFFENSLLHGPISINVPENKSIKYPQTRGYLHQKRVGGNMCTKSQRVDTEQSIWIVAKFKKLKLDR